MYDTKEVWKDICDKMDGINGYSWQDIIKIHDLPLHSDSLRKKVTGSLGAYEMYNFAKQESMSGEQLEELEDKIIEMKKERVKLSNQNRKLSKKVRELANLEEIRDDINNAILNLEKIDYKPFCYGGLLNTSEASLLLSDLHYGLEVNDKLNVFNIDVAKERLFKLRNKTIEHCGNHNVGKLHIELCGDLISGGINLQSRIEDREDVISQVMKCAEELSIFILELSKHIKNIVVHSTIGNHSRVVPSKNESIPRENFERIIVWFIQERLKDVKNITVEEMQVDHVKYVLENGQNVLMVHGHLDKPQKVVQNFERMHRDYKIDYVHMGHYHNYNNFEQFGANILVNGNFCGQDQYAKSLRLYSKPSQALQVYIGDDVCTYKIHL